MNAIKEDGRYLKRILFDNLKLIAILQFIIEFYTFPLVIELIMVPILASLGIFLAMADSKEQFQSVRAFLEGILSLVGMAFLLNAFIRFIIDQKVFGILKLVWNL